MVRYFTRQPEGEAEFKKIGQEYPDELYDTAYDRFLKITKTTKESDVKREIINIKRLILPDTYTGGNIDLKSPREYLVYNMIERRFDALGNPKHHTHSNLGVYPIPVPKWVIRQGGEEDSYEKLRVVEGISHYDSGFSLPYTKESVDELSKWCIWSTSYSIEILGKGHRMQVDSLKDFRDGDTEHLLHFSHIANKYEEQVLADLKAGKIQQIHPNESVRSYA